MLQPNPPIPYRADLETPDADEQVAIDDIKESMLYIIGKTHEDLGHAQRSVHAKSHALLEASVTVHPDLPAELRQGIFAEPGRIYPAIVRISTIPGDPLRDSVSLPRGLAIKLFDVEGVRLPGSEDDATQDFLFASAPAFAAPDAAGFAKNLKLISRTTDRVEWAKGALSWILRPIVKGLEAMGADAGALKAMGGYPETHPLGERYYTQVPLRFGDYVAKLDIVPRSESFRALTDLRIDLSEGPDILREEVAGVMTRFGGEWTLRAQLCRNLETQPIEDASVVWPEEDSPYLEIATIRVGPQTSWSEGRSRAVDDGLTFRPWRGVEVHRPLGNVMRARREVYPVAQQRRSELIGCPMHEPRTRPDLP
ncbi:catalase [Rhizobium sp. Root274]|uniref:catalase family protein n=1 Tax=unclassified Rhizobium TaxID=2613769 RepID=UPI0007138748|nr:MULTISPECIES: catalase family protein [unclassified Rhizobium]KQW27446.1 catalase [Rhizobium sp. Root1240]KRD27683.1 catalase [Rhizobium sp. Root274]